MSLKKIVHRCSLYFKYLREQAKESPNLARCGLIIIPPLLNILFTGPAKHENMKRDPDACNPRRNQDRDFRFACKNETEAKT